MNEELITIPQMADRLQISRRKAYELKNKPGFPFYNLGERQMRVAWHEVLEWIHTRKE
ncbi:AlpA family transcriptional regulator [Paenibacillus sp. NFR01]|uniref:helix-turn-helix transcriptional regulator n=1 Tax=Paenibacillus sp. NFR01 TaxID=1566279 RepID=UPI0011145A5B|nr:excisionase family DNA-binding protein [Paenibacillus sp. NFR01]